MDGIEEDDMVTPTFVVDVTLAISADKKVEAMNKAEERIKSMEKWASENGISFEKAKMEWIGLGKREEDEAERIEVEKGEWKQEAEVVRWLGVWIDRKMNFREHVKRKIKGGEKVAGGIMRLDRERRGIGVGNRRKMYIACARSTMDYGARVW